MICPYNIFPNKSLDQGKKEVDYDKLDPVGVTAVAPVSSRFGTTQDLAFNKSEKMRNGPIASGILTTLLSLGCSKEHLEIYGLVSQILLLKKDLHRKLGFLPAYIYTYIKW